MPAGTARRDTYQPMAKWVADNPNFPGRAWAQWIQLMYRDGALLRGAVRLHGRSVDLRRIDQNLLVVTAGADHIAPRPGTMPIFDLVASEDVDPPRPARRAHRADRRLGRPQARSGPTSRSGWRSARRLIRTTANGGRGIACST